MKETWGFFYILKADLLINCYILALSFNFTIKNQSIPTLKSTIIPHFCNSLFLIKLLLKPKIFKLSVVGFFSAFLLHYLRKYLYVINFHNHYTIYFLLLLDNFYYLLITFSWNTFKIRVKNMYAPLLHN